MDGIEDRSGKVAAQDRGGMGQASGPDSAGYPAADPERESRLLAEARAALAPAHARLDRLAEDLRSAREALAGARAEKEHLARALAAIERSTWWRLGAPLRAVASRFPAAIRPLRRLLRSAYWLLTGQLSAGSRARRGAAIWAGIDLRHELGLPPLIDPPEAAAITLPEYGEASVVSVIIPTYGQVPYTLRCLASIGAAPPRTPTEVIVVDDASGDARVAELRAIPRLRLEVRSENLGFLKSCNDAATRARGAYLLFLNNDTEVMRGAIDALADLLRARRDAGMAGACLLYPDGRLQEAGGIVWRDGSAWNYGNQDDPRRPEYSYVREADYISGAAIMVRRDVWEQLGGFDEVFAPAYCEDSDFAFRVRQAGLKVLYQPAAQVIHFEGISHGTDIATGVKAYQAVNQAKLLQRWQTALRATHQLNGTRIMRARDRSAGRTVTLVIDHFVPEPNRDAGSRTIVAFMDAMIASGRIVKFFPVNRYKSSGYTETLQQRGIEVMYGPWSPPFGTWIETAGAEIDEVMVSRPDVAEAVLGALRAHCAAPIVYYGHDLHYQRLRRDPAAAQNGAKRAAADAMEAQERRVWSAADVVLYPSEEEAALVRALAPGVTAMAIQPYALPPPPPPREPPEATNGLLFVAGFAHPPNVDAALWLVRDILPLIRAVRPGIRLALVGSNPTPEVRELEGDGVEVTGFVTDEALARRYAAARVALCPLRFGAGVKMKVVEAMHNGVPLVTTPAGAQGLEGLETVCDVQDDKQAFAACVLDLLDDDALWRKRAAAQSAYVATRFSAASMQQGLEAAFAATKTIPLLTAK